MSCVHLRDVRSPIRRAHLNAKGGLMPPEDPFIGTRTCSQSIMRALSLEAMFGCP